MARTVPLTPELEIIFQGKKNGLDLYRSSANVVTIRPGSLHLHNGFANFLYQTTEWNTIDVSSGNDSDGVAYTTSWYFVTVDKDGNFRTHAGTGANTVRPSDTVYSWVDDDNTGFKHNKQGYYYNESERIIGAFYRSTDVDYVINNYDITNEVGENANGEWEKRADGFYKEYRSTLTVSYANANQLTGGITFLEELANTNFHISGTIIDGAASTSNSILDISKNVDVLGQTTTGASLLVRKLAGGTGFSAGNTLDLSVEVIGRWRN